MMHIRSLSHCLTLMQIICFSLENIVSCKATVYMNGKYHMIYINHTTFFGAIHKCQHFHECTNHTLSDFHRPPLLKVYGLYTHENVDIYGQPLYYMYVILHLHSTIVAIRYSYLIDTDIWNLNSFTSLVTLSSSHPELTSV